MTGTTHFRALRLGHHRRTIVSYRVCTAQVDITSMVSASSCKEEHTTSWQPLMEPPRIRCDLPHKLTLVDPQPLTKLSPGPGPSHPPPDTTPPGDLNRSTGSQSDRHRFPVSLCGWTCSKHGWRLLISGRRFARRLSCNAMYLLTSTLRPRLREQDHETSKWRHAAANTISLRTSAGDLPLTDLPDPPTLKPANVQEGRLHQSTIPPPTSQCASRATSRWPASAPRRSRSPRAAC
jgi:hypothetical protein